MTKSRFVTTVKDRSPANAAQTRHVARWKAAAHAVLGGVCVRCQFSDSRALQIDHVNDGGALERRETKRTGASFYRHVVANADFGEYQLLCANCNWIKRSEDGEAGGAPRKT